MRAIDGSGSAIGTVCSMSAWSGVADSTSVGSMSAWSGVDDSTSVG
jgi:hypothetical protein